MLLKIFYSPVMAFRAMKDTEKFPTMSLIILLVIVIINNILMIPVTSKVSELSFSSMGVQMSDEQMEYALQIMHKFRYLSALSGVLSYCFMLVIYTLIIWVFTKIAKCKVSFQKTLELVIHCCFVVVIGSLVNTFILYYQGIETIENMYEISLTGLNVLTSSESVGVVLYTFLSLINPFQVWFLALLTVGMAILADVKYDKAFFISFIFWAIITAFPVIVIFFTHSLLQSSGLM